MPNVNAKSLKLAVKMTVLILKPEKCTENYLLPGLLARRATPPQEPQLHSRASALWTLLNLLRVVAHTSWGADQQTLLHVYRSLVRSKLDYGCIIYGSARGSYLQMLDPVQNHALRLCLGA